MRLSSTFSKTILVVAILMAYSYYCHYSISSLYFLDVFYLHCTFKVLDHYSILYLHPIFLYMFL